VAGAGFLGLDARVRHELHGGPEDVAGVLVADDGAVHLGQFPEPGGGKVDADVEAARADGFDGPVRTEDDQGACPATQNAFQAVAEGGSGSHPAQSRLE
jgi:hypothetical protein